MVVDVILGVSVIAVAGAALWLHRRARRAERVLERVERHAELAVRVGLLHARDAVAREAARAAKGPVAPICRAAEGEDVFLWVLFAGKPAGRYIEVGAFDGERHSVTYLFEAVGWTGVLIEAQPELAARCAAARPGSRVVHAALSKRGASGMATFHTLARGDAVRSDSYLASVAGARRRSRHGNTAVQVPLTFMDAVLGPADDPIDFAVIDVEGAEADLLDGFDLSARRVRVILIEELGGAGDGPVAERLTRAGYIRITRIGRNDVYIRGDEAGLAERAHLLTVCS